MSVTLQHTTQQYELTDTVYFYRPLLGLANVGRVCISVIYRSVFLKSMFQADRRRRYSIVCFSFATKLCLQDAQMERINNFWMANA